MKKIFKFSALLLIITTIMIGACGCTMIFPKNDQKAYKPILNQMNEHLAAKYGEFPHKNNNVLPKDFFKSFDECYMYVENPDGTKDKFWVNRFQNDDGTYRFEDNYYGIVIRQQLEDYVKERAQEYFDEVRIIIIGFTSSFDNKYTSASQFDEMVSSGEVAQHIVRVLVPESLGMNNEELDSAGEHFASALKRDVPEASISIINVSNETYLDLSRYNYDLDGWVVLYTKHY